jgi:hypothetical protein
MLVIKVHINLFKSLQTSMENSELINYLLEKRSILVTKITEMCAVDNSKFQLAYSTLLLNYVILFKKLGFMSDSELIKLDTDVNEHLHVEFLQYFNYLSNTIINWDMEALLRMLVCFGTLMCKTDDRFDYRLILNIARSMDQFRQVCLDIKEKELNYSQDIKKCVTYLLKDLIGPH